MLLAVIGLGGYVVYDKAIVKECKEPTQTENKADTTNVMTEEEAIKLGKEKYEYVREGLYLCGTKSVKVDNSSLKKWTLEGTTEGNNLLTYAKITNIDEIQSNLTKHSFINWLNESQIDIKFFEGNYYKNIDGCGGNPSYAYDKYEIIPQKIDENNITYTITEYFYTTDDNGISEDINKADKFTSIFEIQKENNVWKINEYTDASTGYYLLP